MSDPSELSSEPIALRSAFPAFLGGEVDAVRERLRPAQVSATSHDIGPVRIAEESVRIPTRIYAPEPNQSTLGSLPDMQHHVLACIYTRHHDGLVRQRHLQRILPCAHPWMVPFVVQLVGEYVEEILEDIHANLPRIDVGNLTRFVGENGPFLHLTRQRVISYWDCYFRQASPSIHDHVGYRILEWIDDVARHGDEASS